MSGEVAWLTRGQSADFSSQFVPDLAAASSQLKALTTSHGSDLPTMVSRIRLIWTIALTAHMLRTGLRGDVVETGVWAGGSTIAMLSMMMQHNASSPRMPSGFQPASGGTTSTRVHGALPLSGASSPAGCDRISS